MEAVDCVSLNRDFSKVSVSQGHPNSRSTLYEKFVPEQKCTMQQCIFLVSCVFSNLDTVDVVHIFNPSINMSVILPVNLLLKLEEMILYRYVESVLALCGHCQNEIIMLNDIIIW